MSPETTYRRTRRISASFIFLITTSLMTIAASSLIVLALMTEHWEYVEFDSRRVAELAANDTEVHWMLNNRVAQLIFEPSTSTLVASSSSATTALLFITKNLMSKKTPTPNAHIRNTRELRTVFLVPMYGGVWAICTNLKDNEREELAKLGYNHAWCKQYLSPDFVAEGGQNDWITRMQNLSISCAIVCLILLGVSTLIGLFGIVKRQISAVLVTGVMYVLAAVFCIFTLSIMQFKRKSSKDCGLVDTTVPTIYQHAQITTTGWSLTVGWTGVALCFLSSLMWYFLSKIMRYGPITLT